MTKIPVTLRIPIDAAWRVGHRLQVYSDFGSGVIDTDRPLLARPAEPFVGHVKPGGYGGSPYGGVPYGDGPPSLRTGGYGGQPYGGAPYGGGGDHFDVIVYIPDDYDLYKFAAYAIDEEGNEQGDALEEFEVVTSGREPAPLRGFAFWGYDKPTDVATFTFTV